MAETVGKDAAQKERQVVLSVRDVTVGFGSNIVLDKLNLFAMIDALERRQYLELRLRGDDLYADVQTF